MERTSNRNGAIDFLRFVFTLLVIRAHFITYYKLDAAFFRNGHISVEFFFVLSGFLMAASAQRAIAAANGRPDLGSETVSFMKRKVGSIAPVYYPALIVYVIYYTVIRRMRFQSLFAVAAESLPAFLMLPSAGLGERTNITFSWYIGAMLLAMAILYPLLLRGKKLFTCVIAPLLVIFFCAFAMKTYGKIIVLDADWYGIANPSLFRAIGEIVLGTTAYEICGALRRYYADGERLSAFGRVFFTAAEIFAFAVPIRCIAVGVLQKMQLYILFSYAIGVALLMSGLGSTERLFRSPLFAFLGRFSLALYLGQGMALYTLPEIYRTSELRAALVHLALALVWGAVFYLCGILVRRLWPWACSLLVKETERA